MNNIKPYCQFVHDQFSLKRLWAPCRIPSPVKGNAIILITFLEDKTVLADIFTLKEVDTTVFPTIVRATNRHGKTVSGIWGSEGYVWPEHINDLHSWVQFAIRGYHRPFNKRHRRYVRQVMQCVKDQVVVCMDLLPNGCEYSDTVIWANPVKRKMSTIIFGSQLAITPLYFNIDLLPAALCVSVVQMVLFQYFHRKETSAYLIPDALLSQDAFKGWIELTRHVHVGSRTELLPALKEKMDLFFKDAIERTSPDYSLLMQTRYRIAQESLEEIIQADSFSKLKFMAYRTRVIGFIADL